MANNMPNRSLDITKVSNFSDAVKWYLKEKRMTQADLIRKAAFPDQQFTKSIIIKMVEVALIKQQMRLYMLLAMHLSYLLINGENSNLLRFQKEKFGKMD